jgi:proline dehydrogenase
LAHAQDLDEDGITALVDLLGEHVEQRSAAETAVRRYKHILDRINAADVDAELSIKLTHLGLELSTDYCRSNVHHLVDHAADHDTFIWIDMESADHTEATITLYKELRDVHDNVGICIQSYLKRSQDDIQDLVEHDGIIRLVKGAYNEPEEIAYRDRAAVREQYRQLLDQLFAQDTYFAVATHDKQLIDYAQELEDQYGKNRDKFEFQFLMGVRTGLQRELAEQGYTVSQYVPYGPDWLPYYWRRIRERKENLVFAATAVVRSLLDR